MKRRTILAFSLAAASLALLSPNPSFAQNPGDRGTQIVPGATSDPAAQQEAATMAPAQAALENGLDARHLQTGSQIQAKLTDSVHLKDGRKLPRGTRLIGSVTAGSTQPGAASRLAIRFTQAYLKDGKTLPITASIVGEAPPYDSRETAVATDISPTWDGKTVQFDEMGVISGVDLHSRIGAENSGIFVATGRDDVKLAAGSRLALAINDQSSMQTSAGAAGGS